MVFAHDPSYVSRGAPQPNAQGETMWRSSVGALACLVVACSSSSSPSQPAQCDPMTQRVGTYVLHYDVESGNCGAINDSLIILNGMTAPPMMQGCTFVSSGWSEGNCRYDTQFQCTINGQTFMATGYSVQETQDGSLLTGEASVSVPGICSGMYRLTYTRR
jgi:hypothetical protein